MKKINKKLIAYILSTVFAFSVLLFVSTGCEAAERSIYVITMFGGTDAHREVFEQINDEFERDTRTVVENNSSGSSTTWQINVRNAFLIDRTTPDVLYYFNGAAADSIRSHLVSVEQIVSEYSGYGGDISVKIGDGDCLPLKGFTEGIIYRADEGYFSPSDFASYATLKQRIMQHKSDETKQVSAGHDTPHYWINYLMTLRLGAEEFAAFDGTKAFFAAEPGRYERWQEAVAFTVGELTDMGICTNPDRTENSATGASESDHFFAGRRGLLVDGSWAAGRITAGMDVTGFPRVSQSDTPFSLSGFTSGWFITKKAWNDPEKRESAVKYVMQHTTAGAIDRYCQDAGGIPATGLPVTGASSASNKFASLLTDGVMSVTPIDDRMPDAAKTLFYSTRNGIPAILVGESQWSIQQFFEIFYNYLV